MQTCPKHQFASVTASQLFQSTLPYLPLTLSDKALRIREVHALARIPPLACVRSETPTFNAYRP